MDTIAQERAIRMLKDDPKRDIYEAGTSDGKSGSGKYFVTYSQGRSPLLCQDDIDWLVRARVLRAKHPGCYVLLN